MHTYFLSYNPFDPRVTAVQIHSAIQDSKIIAQYFQPWIGCYILKSIESSVTITQRFQGLFDQSTFLLSRIDPHTTGGRLSPEIWQWINTGSFPNALAGYAPPALPGE